MYHIEPGSQPTVIAKSHCFFFLATIPPVPVGFSFQLLWDRALPEDESNALDRCLSALSEVLGEGAQSQSKSGRNSGARCSDGASTPTTVRVAVGVLAVRAGVKRRWNEAAGRGTAFIVDHNQDHRAGLEDAGVAVENIETESRGDAEGNGSSPGLSPPRAKQKLARGARDDYPASARPEPDTPNAPSGLEGRTCSTGSGVRGGLGPASGAEQPNAVGGSAAVAVEAIVDGEGAKAPSHSKRSSTRGEEKEKKENACIPSAVRERISLVADMVAAAGARGATSTDMKNAAAAAVSLLQEAMKLPLADTNTHEAGTPSNSSEQLQQQLPLEVVCSGIGLGISRDKGPATATAGCGDDLVMVVCDSFVTPSLSLKNCLAFVKAVLVPRARALTTPASRLLVTAVSGIGKARPGVVVDGLILPLLCEGDPSMVGSAQCELCTRLIKQVKDTYAIDECGVDGLTIDFFFV